MTFAAPILVGMMLLDFLQPLTKEVSSVPDAAHSETGKGELTVNVTSMHSLGSVPRGATRIPFLTVNLSASCDSDITLASIVLRHTGLGLSDDIASVYAVDGFTRVSRAARFDRRGNDATLRFRSMTIPRCGASTIDIFADMSVDATVASEHGVVLRDVAGILSTAKKTTLETGDASRRVISAPTDAGVLAVRFLPVSNRVRYGRIETVARLQLTADTRSAHLLRKITFTNRGGARDMDLQWIALEMLSGSVLTAPAPRMRGSTVTLDFDPTFILEEGRTLVLNLKAEIRGSQSRKIDFFLQEPSDLVASPYRQR